MVAVPEVGENFEERYKLLSILGSGIMGSVFKARQLDCDRSVALKISTIEIAADEEMKARFLQEGRALSLLSHANIVTIYHLAVSQKGNPYLVMELASGESLRCIIAREKKLPATRALKIIQQACEALAYAHSKCIVHRDLKPENMILLQTPNPDFLKIIDFGLAKFVYGESSEQIQHLTQTGMLIGTVNYMSPEQSNGHAADNRSDIYALTVCLYEMLTGNTPYTADASIGILYKHINDPVPRLVPRELMGYHPLLQKFIDKGMSKNIETRFQTMTEMKMELDKVLDKLDSSPPAIHSFTISVPWLSGTALKSAIVLAIIFLLTVPMIFPRHKDSDEVLNTRIRAHHKDELLSPTVRLKRISDKLDDDSLFKNKPAPLLRQTLDELEQIIRSKGMSRGVSYVANFRKFQLQDLLKVPFAERKKTLEKCLSYCKTADGRESIEAAQIYYWLGCIYFEDGQLAAAEAAAKKSYDLHSQAESEDPEAASLDIPPMLDISGKVQPLAAVCTMLGEIAEARGNNSEALKWFDLCLKKTKSDSTERWTQVCQKAGLLIKMGRENEANRILQEHADTLYELGLQNYGAKHLESLTGLNITENSISVLGKLGDWASARGDLDFAKSSYQQQCRLIEKTGVLGGLKEAALQKLAEIETKQKKAN